MNFFLGGVIVWFDGIRNEFVVFVNLQVIGV